MRFVVVGGALALIVIVIGAIVRRSPRGATAATGARLVSDVPPTPSTIALLERWRDRTTRWRLAVAVPAVIASLGLSIVAGQSVEVGVGSHPAWADPLLVGLVGAFGGAIAAEMHHLRPQHARRPRTVDLAPRDLGAYLPHGSRRRLFLIGLAGLAAVIAEVVLVGGVPILGLGALGLLALVPVTQSGIVRRGRPALVPELRRADDAVRRLAIRSVDEAGAGASLLLVAWQLAPVYSTVDLPEIAEFGLVAAQLACLVIAVLWWRRSQAQRLLPDVAGALAPARRQEAACD